MIIITSIKSVRNLAGSLALIPVLLVPLAGCHHGTYNITGTWVIDASMMQQTSGPAASLMSAMNSSTYIKFASNGQFSQKLMGFPQNGTYKVVGNKVKMNLVMFGKAVPMNPDGVITNGGKTITFNSGPKLIAFKRSGT